MKRYEFNTRDETVKDTDCKRVFYVPGVDEERCEGEVVDIDGFGEKMIICEAEDCPLILAKVAVRAERGMF